MYDFWDYFIGFITLLPFLFVIGFFLWMKGWLFYIMINSLLGNTPAQASDDEYLSIRTKAYDYDEDGY